jgi:activator of 2-hydroxyglutaryl-CoA dehydratase
MSSLSSTSDTASKNMPKVNFGIDIGSISVNFVVTDNERKILDNRYFYCQGQPFAALLGAINEMADQLWN